MPDSKTASRWVERRRLLGTAAGVVAAALALSACGFKLSHPPRLAFRTAALAGFAPESPLATELARALEASGVQVVETTAQAAAAGDLSQHVILQAITDSRDEVVASTTAFGQVRDMSLRTRFAFALLRVDGSVVLPRTELGLARDVTYNEKDALAKQDEFTALHRVMQSDLVAQTLRRLAAVTPEQLARP